jgi:hypothetical protein
MISLCGCCQWRSVWRGTPGYLPKCWLENSPLLHNQPVQTYRNPGWSLVIQVVLSTFMALIGVGIAVHPGNAGHPGTAPGYIAFGSILAAVVVFMIVGQLMTRLIVTEHGLTWRSFLRTRSIAWSDIQDVLVVPAKALGRYYSPGIKVDGRRMRINSVIGPRRYTETIVTAIRDAQLRARVASESAAHLYQGPAAPPVP